MLASNRCHQCGAEFDGRAGGVCPACLMQLGLHEWVDLEAPADAATADGPARRMKLPKPDELASHFPHLEILDLIGQGGMGAVYKARQVRLDRMVALKIIVPEPGEEQGFSDRFQREARALARLSHPSIVTVHDFGTADGLYYLIMEYVEGTNLRTLIHSGEFPPDKALSIVPELCDALEYAHERGVVHRDIKPENILVDLQGHVKIADFGLAKLVDHARDSRFQTQTGHVVGTPHYMAPEQLERPLEVDHRADIYSLGVVFYEMLTGELPLGRFQRPSKRVSVDVRLDRVVLRALEKEPNLRYQHASEIGGELKSIRSSGSSKFNLGASTTVPMETFIVNLFIMGTVIPLSMFTAIWTQSPWPVLGFCLPLFFLGAGIEEYGGPHLLALAGACLFALAVAIGVVVAFTGEAFVLGTLVPAFISFCVGCAVGEEEVKKKKKKKNDD